MVGGSGGLIDSCAGPLNPDGVGRGDIAELFRAVTSSARWRRPADSSAMIFFGPGAGSVATGTSPEGGGDRNAAVFSEWV
jgi:hypothetical protein